MSEKQYLEKEIVVDYLRDKLCSKCRDFESWTPEECKDCLATKAIESIEMASPADVKPVVRGEWISMGDFEQCSACKGTHLKKVKTYYGEVIWLKSDFCPNCGAAMSEEALRIIAERNKWGDAEGEDDF